MSSGIQKQLDEGAVPNHVSNVCPKGTKMWVRTIKQICKDNHQCIVYLQT